MSMFLADIQMSLQMHNLEVSVSPEGIDHRAATKSIKSPFL